MNEKQMVLGYDYAGQDPAGWLLSGKFDGCRAYWDGSHLWTRGGHTVKAPAWFLAGLPTGQHLDCELWAGYGGFQAARMATQYGTFNPAIRLRVFDCPTATGDWPQRMKVARRAIGRASVAECVTFRPCASLEDLRSELQTVLARGGEGLVLRAPGVSRYETGRTHGLLKVKRI